MNRITIYDKTRKIIALFLLAILVVVNIQKTFHHHDTTSCHSHQKQQIDFSKIEKESTQFLSTEVNCSLCDYYFAKDVVINFVEYSIFQFPQFNSAYNEYEDQQIISVKYYIENKGPPSQI